MERSVARPRCGGLEQARHALGIDAKLAVDPVGDELAALDEAADCPGGDVENGGHLSNRKKTREAEAVSSGSSTFVIPRRGRSLLLGRPRNDPRLALVREGVLIHLVHRAHVRAPDESSMTPSSTFLQRFGEARPARMSATEQRRAPRSAPWTDADRSNTPLASNAHWCAPRMCDRCSGSRGHHQQDSGISCRRSAVRGSRLGESTERAEFLHPFPRPLEQRGSRLEHRRS